MCYSIALSEKSESRNHPSLLLRKRNISEAENPENSMYLGWLLLTVNLVQVSGGSKLCTFFKTSVSQSLISSIKIE
ncbi:hypothetical protein [Wolbachia pipientis]|uniref:hypothetical protein n=1 Tax=Wolbachia pipientis TaxID=955 RepID=UPI0025A40705|nr:hypothetical protein [Wolbachia pipientis]MDM8335499.1 hypothetical protein [Wolbachia pipientis]